MELHPQIIRMYADGVYDVFHLGHARQLEQAKKAFPLTYVIAGVSGQEETFRMKGATLMNEDERIQALNNCKWVDEVLCPCLWVLTDDFLDNMQINYVAHDALPYVSAGSGDIYQHVKELGKFFETKRTEGVSTSDVIVRIIKNREIFYNQLLNQGYDRKDLNLSFFDIIYLKINGLAKRLFGCDKRKEKATVPPVKENKKN